MKLKIFLLLTIFLLPTLVSAQNLIGYEHKGVIFGAKLPNGAKDLGGGLLSDEDYGVSRYTTKNNFMLWLEKIVERDADGIPTWQVKDILTFPKLKKNQEFLLSYSSNCQQNDNESLDLVVMAEFSSKKKTYKINGAWLANVETEKFEKVSIKGIECAYVAP